MKLLLLLRSAEANNQVAADAADAAGATRRQE
jgi:hypothetical protein